MLHKGITVKTRYKNASSFLSVPSLTFLRMIIINSFDDPFLKRALFKVMNRLVDGYCRLGLLVGVRYLHFKAYR